jgi:two-component system, cell cycle sensor histidine kinase and response regulator CckA
MTIDLTLGAAALFSSLAALVSAMILTFAAQVARDAALRYWAAAYLLLALFFPIRAVWGNAAGTDPLLDTINVAACFCAIVGALRFTGGRVDMRLLAIGGLAVWTAALAMRNQAVAPWSNVFNTTLNASSLLFAAVLVHRLWSRTRERYLALLAACLYAYAAARIYFGGFDRAFEGVGVPALLLMAAFRFTSAVLLLLIAQQRVVKHLQTEIAERQLAEAAARENQTRFEQLLDLSSDWFWELDPELRYTYVSPRVSEISGMPTDFYIGKRVDEVAFVDTRDGLRQELYDRLRRRQSFRNLRLGSVHRTTGKTVHYEMSGGPVYDANGRLLGFRGVGRDRTQDFIAKSALEVILGGVADTVGSDYLVALVSHLGRTLNVDVAFIGARTRDEQRLRSLARWMDGEVTQNIEFSADGAPAAEVLAGNTCEYPEHVRERFPAPWLRERNIEAFIGIPLVDRNGRTMGVLGLMKRTPIRNPDLIRAVLRALAPRAAAEMLRQVADEQARDAEGRFKSVVDNMSSGLLVKVGNRYTIANRTYAEWVGIPVEELVGMTDVELFRRMGWTDEQQKQSAAVQRQAATSGQPRTWENTARFGDGRVRETVITNFPIPSKPGEAPTIALLITDVTQLRRAERQLQQSHKMDALGRLAGGVAHDFNNIVGAIAGFARFIIEDTPESSATHEHGERILAASQRAKQLIQQILTFSRRTEVKSGSVPVAQAIDETVALLRTTLPATTAIKAAPIPPNLFVRGDVTQLGQVLLNVCVNASDALGGQPGEIDISVAREGGGAAAEHVRQYATTLDRDAAPRAVVGELDARVDYVALRIRDTGAGMSRNVIENIFEPFFTTKPPGQGTGLGLAVVHGIVLSHGGAIGVASRPGQETEFTIWLPEAERRAVARPAVNGTRTGRILVVDDDADFGDMVAMSMERMGYEVVVANRARDAIEAVGEDPQGWDLVITDHSMPGLTGLEMIAEIKQRRPNLPCILCTGYGRDVTETAARAGGASDFLTKPVDPILLGEAVARIIAADAHGA